ncbi:MAG: hypothetical protein KDB01_27335, partial [Planctomycetaceae bacterium]|nr:hypothetical protein [Planctomycetaceae bacterium]
VAGITSMLTANSIASIRRLKHILVTGITTIFALKRTILLRPNHVITKNHVTMCVASILSLSRFEVQLLSI